MPTLKTPRIRFTKTALNSLSANGTKPQSLYDDEVKKLCIRAYASGRKVFYLKVRVNEQPDAIKLGEYPFMSIENARKSATEKLAVIMSGGNPKTEQQEARRQITFHEYFERYCARSNKKSLDCDRGYYRLYLEKRWAKKRMGEIKRADVEEMFADVTKNSGRYAANHALVLMRTLYNQAIADEIVAKNPTSGIKKNAVESRDRFLTESEMPFFLDACDAEENQQAAQFLKLLLFTGQRKSNVLAMRWEEIDWEASEWRIPMTKNGEPHVVALVDEALAALAKVPRRNSPWVFAAADGHKHIGEPRKSWSRVLRRATLLQLIELLRAPMFLDGQTAELFKKTAAAELDTVIERFRDAARILKTDTSATGFTGRRRLTLHDLRRTHGSWLARNNVSLPIIGQILGHKSIASTRIYSRLGNEPLRQQVAAITAKMSSFASSCEQLLREGGN